MATLEEFIERKTQRLREKENLPLINKKDLDDLSNAHGTDFGVAEMEKSMGKFVIKIASISVLLDYFIQETLFGEYSPSLTSDLGLLAGFGGLITYSMGKVDELNVNYEFRRDYKEKLRNCYKLKNKK